MGGDTPADLVQPETRRMENIAFIMGSARAKFVEITFASLRSWVIPVQTESNARPITARVGNARMTHKMPRLIGQMVQGVPSIANV